MTKPVSLYIARQFSAVFTACLLVTSLVACTATDGKVHSSPGTTTKIILTRHAERTTVTKVLTPTGHQRARDLVGAVEGLDIAAIYSPDLERNLDTARPLAKHLSIDIMLKPAESRAQARTVVTDILEKHAGKTVLWVGNVGNLNNMYWYLGGEGDGPIAYGDLFVITVPDQGEATIDKRRFGAGWR